MDARVRPYEDGDEEEVVALWEDCGLVVPWNDPRRDIARKLTTQRELFAVAETAETGGAIVATVMAGYDGHRGWVNYLAVAPPWRRRGLGRRLMDWAEARLSERGCAKVNLQVRSENTVAIRFYEAIGYRRDDVVSLGRRLEIDGPVGPQGHSAVAAGCVPYEKRTRLAEVEEP